MAKTSTTQSTNTNIYKYTAGMSYILDGNIDTIENINIKTIVIDSNYNDMNMPMIFVTLGLYKRLINKMVLNQDRGIILLNIKRCVTNSHMPDLYTDYIDDKFIYFISGDLSNSLSTIEIPEDNPNDSDDVDTVTLGLLSLDHVNKNKRNINGVLNGKMSSIMYYTTSHLPIVIEPPKNNKMMENLFIPPMNSVSKTLQYLNFVNVFYTTPYRFFIDFDRSYLISSSGKAVKYKGEYISTVMMNIYDEDKSKESKIQGMITDRSSSMYILELDSEDCELVDNHVSEKSYSKISATNTSGNKIEGTLSNISKYSSIKTKTRSIRIMNDNNGILDNMISYLDTSAIQLLVQKIDIDSSIFTMNKEYIVQAEDAYNTETYNGRYILVRKRELYVREDDNFTMNVMLLFRKVQ